MIQTSIPTSARVPTASIDWNRWRRWPECERLANTALHRERMPSLRIALYREALNALGIAKR